MGHRTSYPITEEVSNMIQNGESSTDSSEGVFKSSSTRMPPVKHHKGTNFDMSSGDKNQPKLHNIMSRHVEILFDRLE